MRSAFTVASSKKTLPRCLPIVPRQRHRRRPGIKIHRWLEIHRTMNSIGKIAISTRFRFFFFSLLFSLFLLPFLSQTQFSRGVDSRSTRNVKAHLRLAGKFHSVRARFVPTRSIRSLEIGRLDPVFPGSRNRHAPRKIDQILLHPPPLPFLPFLRAAKRSSIVTVRRRITDSKQKLLRANGQRVKFVLPTVSSIRSCNRLTQKYTVLGEYYA